MFTSEVVMTGFASAEASAQILSDIEGLLALERRWYENAPRFQTSGQILRAYNAGELEHVVPDKNVQPIMRYTNPRLDIHYPPFLMPYAVTALRELGRQWRFEAGLLGVHPNVRLSVTSLVRSQEYQDELVRKGKPAVSDSTHMTGGTFDLDLAGYHIVGFSHGRDATVSRRELEPQKRIAKAFAKDFSARDLEPVRLGPEYFDPNVAAALMNAATALYYKGVISMVPEGADSENGALHIAVAPPYVTRTL